MRTPRFALFLALAITPALPVFAQTTTPPANKTFICNGVESKYAKLQPLLIKKITDKLTAAPHNIPAANIKVKLKKQPDTNVEQIDVTPNQASIDMSITVGQNPLSIPALSGELEVDALDSCSITRNFKATVTIKGTPAQKIEISNIAVRIQGRFKEKKN